jgi:Flp pilus assembly CpaF family ATPase
MFLRKIQKTPLILKSFCEESSFIESLIVKKKNILIAGSTGSGKSSLLSSLLGFIPQEEHVIILEDHFELTCSLPFTTRLVGQDFSVLVPRSLRMTPDRIILGEIRSYEVLGLQLILNTGHQGVMATLHASSAVNALERLALLYTIYAKNLEYALSLKLFCQNIHHVIFLEKGRIETTIEIKGSLGDKVLYIEE